MNKKFIFVILLIVSLLLATGLCLHAQSLSGNVTSAATHQPIEGASIFFPQLRKGSFSDSNGVYKISPIPNGKYQVELEMVGYATIIKQVSIIGNSKLDFALVASTSSLSEVTITSLGNVTTKQRSPVPVTVVSHDMLMQQSSTNAIDAIAKQPGITAITTGPGVSKPEINGLGYNRVLTLMDGERQEDFQWGDEHGVLIDPYMIYNAEIIRGAASLQYGANAVAGVVSFKSEPLPEEGVTKGSYLSEYQTNNGLIGNSLDVAGNKNGLAWDIRGSYEAAHCYQDPHDGYVWSTAYTQDNIRGVIELTRKWGFSRLSASLLDRQVEIPDGNRDSATGKFMFDVPPVAGQIFPSLSNYLSYKPNIAGYQILHHDEVWWQNSINVGNGKLEADLGYSQSIRHEVDSGTVGQENMIVHDIPYSINYQGEIWKEVKLTTGTNGMYEFENNYPEPDSPYIGDFEIPNYHSFDIGGYGILQKDFENLTISGGLRYDLRSITGQPMYLANYNTASQQEAPVYVPGVDTLQFPAFKNTYKGISGSFGVTYQLPKHNYVKLNIAKSYRAPAINELTSNELDPSNVYKLGDPHLKAEEGYELDISYGNNNKDFSFEVDGYYNYITHFIFPARIPSLNGGDSMELGAPVYKYAANTAIIAGATAYLKVHPETIKWFEWDNGFTYNFSYLIGQADSERYVPFTPAPRLTSEVKLRLPNLGSFLGASNIHFGLEHDWAQNDIYSAVYNELPSLAYTLYNAGLGTNFINPKSKKVICSLFINSTNLTNLAYIEHTSRPQYFLAYNSQQPNNFGVNAAVVTNRNQGIYNMGRNVSIKVVVPIGIKGNKTK
jgi:iron complex outermembrane receptor protein